MKKIMGIEYGRGCTARVLTGGPALGPAAVRHMFPNADWITVIPDDISVEQTMADRFGENALIQEKIYNATPATSHVMIGGDHSVNFGHFARIADQFSDQDVCLIYVDAHLDIHSPETSRAQASGAPHGTNVRALLGDGDARWLALGKRVPAVRPENVFYLASRSFEPAEIEYVRNHNIFIRMADQLQTRADVDATISEIRSRIGNRKYVVSFDFDAIDPAYFGDVLVPEDNGLSLDVATTIVREFAPNAHSFEFVEYAPTTDAQSHNVAKSLISIALGE